jgi:hypothetical protein
VPSLTQDRRLSDLESKFRPESRFLDVAVQFVAYERLKNDKVVTTGDYSPIYGGNFDKWYGIYTGKEPETILYYPVSLRQLEIIVDDHPRRVALGGRGGGKSESACGICTRYIAELFDERGQIVSPSFRLGRILWAKMWRIIPTEWIHQIRISDKEWWLANGSHVRFMSADNPDSLRSWGGSWAVYDESQDISDEAVDIGWLSLRETSDPILVETATPKVGEFQDRHDKLVELPDISKVFSFPSRTNCFISPKVFEIAEKTMDEDLYRQEVLAEFVTGRGLTYWCFDKGLHAFSYDEDTARKTIQRIFKSIDPRVGRDITEKDMQRRFNRRGIQYVVGMDFNVKPMCSLIYKIFSTPDGYTDLIWAIDECILDDKADATQMGIALKRKGYANSLIIPDASGKRSTGGISSITMLIDLGFQVTSRETNPAVEDRVHAVCAKMLNANNEVTFLIDTKCAKTINAVRKQINGTDGVPDKKSGHDHFTDALGYPIAFLYPVWRREKRNVA